MSSKRETKEEIRYDRARASMLYSAEHRRAERLAEKLHDARLDASIQRDRNWRLGMALCSSRGWSRKWFATAVFFWATSSVLAILLAIVAG